MWHTTYTGTTIADLSASFGVDISTLGHSNSIWMDDASYKDVSGNSAMTAKESVLLSSSLSNLGKTFRKITKNDLNRMRKIMDTFASKSAVGASYKTYVNSKIRAGKFNPSYDDYLKYVDKYYETKIIKKVKMEKTKQIKREIKQQLLAEIRRLKKFFVALTEFQRLMIESKQIIINALNRVKSIGTFVKTSTGYKVVNPEGYVAIDKEGNAVKLVDRMEFSLNNFTVAKDWDK